MRPVAVAPVEPIAVDAFDILKDKSKGDWWNGVVDTSLFLWRFENIPTMIKYLYQKNAMANANWIHLLKNRVV